MHKDLFWTGHVLSGNSNLFQSFSSALPGSGANAVAAAAAPAAQRAVKGAVTAAPAVAAAVAPPNPDGMRSGWMYACAVKVTANHFQIDSNDPAASLSASIDWNNAAAQQAPILCIWINQEAPAVAAHDAPQYALQWADITAQQLSACPTVGDVVSLIRNHYS